MRNVLFILICFLVCEFAHAEEVLCPQVVLHSKESLQFSDTELHMICGDPDDEAYQTIPLYQARYFITGFLQSRGYLLPKFEITNHVLHVHLGEKSKIKKIYVNTGETKERKHVIEEIQRQYKKKKLTPRMLDSIESDGLSVVRRRGFPCAKVNSEANAQHSSITLNYEDLNFFTFGQIEREEIEGLGDNALDRFYPFEPYEAFDEMLLDLTEKRMLRAEVVSGTYFLEKCSLDAQEFSLSQHFILGPPRTIRFGVGANTEMGPMVRVRWSNNRYQDMASQLSANLQVSFRIQTLNFIADQFLWKSRPRFSLLSKLEVSRESQYEYLQTVTRLSSHAKWTQDMMGRFWMYTLGPTLEAGSFRASENDSTRSYRTGSLEGSLMWMSHIYEFYDIHPEEGDTFGFHFDFRHPRLGFEEPLLKLDSTFAKLSRIGVWDRGNLIGGIRMNAATTLVPGSVSLIELPPSVKFYGGGSDDVRGFLLRTLPKNDGIGALSKLGLKLEVRRTYLFLESLEGFVFVDGARFGERSWWLDRRVWYSPGIGLRWRSPIGMVQTYAARARATQPVEDFGNLYFIGLGVTF